ncbi:MAG: tRNA uracil 4-sulfurtransferase ThiI [Desulfurococcaceae archaeon]
MPNYLITVSGEIPLRSKRTRPRFYRKLIKNIEDLASRIGARVLESEIIDAKIFISTDKDILDKLQMVFGIHRVARVFVFKFDDLKSLAETVSEMTKNKVIGKKFAVRVKRSGKHDFTSLDVAREIGSLLRPHSSGVDLEDPDVVIELEVRGNMAYLYEESVKGPGGLPIGIEGKALVLFSGGFDSPVASWFMAKRGVEVDFLHYFMGLSKSSYYAYLVARKLAENWLIGYRPRFIIVDFTPVIKEIIDRVEWSYRQVVLRALMYIIGERIAEKLGYSALVTGESVGQASSQTLQNISTIERIVKPEIPILRPLLGFDKEEIIEYSRKIGLYDLSSKVIEACAIAPRKVITSPDMNKAKSMIARIDNDVIEKALSTMKVLDLLQSPPENVLLTSDLEIDFIPENALIIDVRDIEKSVSDPVKGAIHISKVNLDELPKDKTIMFICDTGSISSLFARELRERGFKAYSLKGGLSACKRHD